jgi:hypothetical protein
MLAISETQRISGLNLFLYLVFLVILHTAGVPGLYLFLFPVQLLSSILETAGALVSFSYILFLHFFSCVILDAARARGLKSFS